MHVRRSKAKEGLEGHFRNSVQRTGRRTVHALNAKCRRHDHRERPSSTVGRTLATRQFMQFLNSLSSLDLGSPRRPVYPTLRPMPNQGIHRHAAVRLCGRRGDIPPLEALQTSELTWKSLVRTLWTAIEQDQDQTQGQSLADALMYGVSCLGSSDSRLSLRLGHSLVTVAHYLGATKDLWNRHPLPIEFERMPFRKLVHIISLLAEASVVDGRLLDALSLGIDKGCLDDLRTDELLVLLNSMAGVNWQGTESQKTRITAAAMRHRAHLDPAASVGLLHLLTRATKGRVEDIQAASGVVSGLLPMFTMKDLGIAAKAYVRLATAPPREGIGEDGLSSSIPLAMLDKIAAQAAQCVEGADPKDLVRLIQAFQVAELRPEGLLDVLDVWADKRLAAMNASGISLAMTHFARVGEASPRLLKTAVNVAESNVERLTPSDASRLLWAFARLQYHPGQVLLRKGVRVLQREELNHATAPLEVGRASYLSDRELANLFWGLVRLEQYPSAAEQHSIAASLLQNPGKVSGQSAALLLWSFASSQEAIGGSMRDLAPFKEAMYRLGTDLCADVRAVDSQSISITAWSLGVLKVKHSEFAACLDTLQCDGKLDAFEPQHVANLVWGLAKSGSRPSPEFMSEVAGALSGRMSLYSPQELFNICWGFATMGFASDVVADETLAELKARGSEFGGLELSGISWALSRILKQSCDPNISEESSRILQLQLAKHVEELEPSQVAMAVVGIARLSVMADVAMHSHVDESLVTDLVHLFCASFGSKLSPTTSSVNTLLEGLALLRGAKGGGRWRTALEAVNAALQDDENLSNCLNRAQFWELCDLCYYLSLNDMPLAKRILTYIESTIAAERVTPRGAIMLLETMRRCAFYPPITLDKATSKLNTLSPNYRLGNEWLTILRDVLLKDERLAGRVRFDHGIWDERLRA